MADIWHNIKEIKVDTNHEEFKKVEAEIKNKINKLLSVNGNKTVDEFHRELGLLCGIMLACRVMPRDCINAIDEIKRN